MAYQKQTWRDFDDTKTELQNINNGAVATPERLNHIENGIANSADKAEVTAQLQQTEQNLNAQLAQKAGFSYVDQAISTMTNGAIKGTYTTLQDLKSAYPDGTIGPFLIEETQLRYIWDVNKLYWVSIGTYDPAEIQDGDITNSKIANKTIQYQKTDFIRLDTSVNMFDGSWLSAYLAGNTPYQFTTNQKGNVAILEVLPATTYSVAIDTNLPTYTKVADSSTLVTSGSQPNGAHKEIGTAKNILFTTSETAKYLYLSTTNVGLPAPFMKVVESDVFVPIAEGESYPINPYGINVYNKDEVDSLFDAFLTEENESWVV